MNYAVRLLDVPAGSPQKLSDLEEKLKSIVGLIRRSPGMPDFCVNFIQTHQVEIVWRCKKKHAAGPCDPMKFEQTLLRIRQVLYGFTRNDQIKMSVRKWKGVRISLHKIRMTFVTEIQRALMPDLYGGAREIEAIGIGTIPCKSANESPPATGNF